ncbi:MAG: hypothetical protein NZ874_09460 [Fimbriimonadales bacterium]|nr:hypothetical protein [Fimbriimonadales bacterium]
MRRIGVSLAIAPLETPIGKCFQLEIVSFPQGRLGTRPYPKTL